MGRSVAESSSAFRVQNTKVKDPYCWSPLNGLKWRKARPPFVPGPIDCPVDCFEAKRQRLL